jgi:copper resistance protein B
MRRFAVSITFALAAALASPALAQHAGHGTGSKAVVNPASRSSADQATTAPPMDGNMTAEAEDVPGNAEPPPVPADHAADRYFPAPAMAAARAELNGESAWRGAAVIVDRLELQVGNGRNGYAWKGEGWWGSDLTKLVIATEGEGAFGETPERTEVRGVVRRAISPFFNLEAGVRHDFQPGPRRTYAVLGLDGEAPYWIDTEAQLFVSTKGDVHARLSAKHDMRLAGPLVLQPEAELNVAFQDVPELGVGAGLERIEAGARLRYEVRPEFAPYLGVSWERSFAGTARALRAADERVSSLRAVAGLHAFF